MPILTIAGLTLREATRRRLILAVVGLTVLTVAGTGWGFSRLSTISCGPNGQPCPAVELKTVAATLLILVTYMFSMVLALAASFVAAPAIGGEIESGIVLAILPRPIRRSDIVLGKWAGLAVLIAGYALLSGALECLAVGITTGYLPPHPIKAIAFLAGEGVMIMTLSILISTRLPTLTCGIVAVVLYGVAWIGGIAQAIGTAFEQHALTTVGTITTLLLPTDGLWRGVLYNLEPGLLVATAAQAGRAARANPFVALAPPPPAYLVWAALWVCGMLALASWSFSRRDL